MPQIVKHNKIPVKNACNANIHPTQTAQMMFNRVVQNEDIELHRQQQQQQPPLQQPEGLRYSPSWTTKVLSS